MATYKTIKGDTFELIARKKLGTEQKAGTIKRQNPGLVEPLVVGTSVFIPESTKDKPQQAPSASVNEVSVLIAGKRFRFWNALRIEYGVDSIATIELGTPFEPDAPGFKETFKPFSYKRLEVTIGGEPLFTGTMIGVSPDLGNNRKVLNVSGYSLPGVLNDCTAPSGAYPLEFEGQTIKGIAETLAGNFNIPVVFNYDPGPVFSKPITCGATAKVLDFLAGAAKQRNFIIRSTKIGALEFLRSKEKGQPVAVLRQGETPVLSVTPAFNEQSYYSHITGLQPYFTDAPGSQYTAPNPFVTEAIRPFTFEAPDTEDTNVQDAVNAKLGRMFGDMVSYSVSLNTWRDPAGALWEPNTTIKLAAPGAMIYNPYEFLIRSVSLLKDDLSETAVLNLVLPGAFSGKIPEALPWDV